MAGPNEPPRADPAPRRLNPPARHRPGTGTVANAAPARPIRSLAGRRMALPNGGTLPWLFAGLLILGCIALLAWGLGLRSDLEAARAESATREQELAIVRLGANATAYTLVPTADGPELARGIAFFQPAGAGVLQIANLPRLDSARTYQLWYLPEGDLPPLPGDTFALNEDGIAFSLIPADVGTFRALGVSVEPTAGSQTPAGSIIMLGTVGGARG